MPKAWCNQYSICMHNHVWYTRKALTIRQSGFHKCKTGKGKNSKTLVKWIRKDLWAKYTLLICYLIYTLTFVAFVEIHFTLPWVLYAFVKLDNIKLMTKWMALFSWITIFVDWTQMKHLLGSKFVAIVFSIIIHAENHQFVGTGIRGSDHPRKPRKLVPNEN